MATENVQRLVFAGPPDPVHGFPLWFEDGNGLRLELALDPDPLTPAVGELPDPTEPQHFPDNFPDESFYFMAEARLPVGGAGVVGRARVILALEAAFGGAGEPKPGLNVVFARIRVRIDDVVPGADYTVTHPYGVTDPLPADENGRVFHTLDLGIVEGNPTAVALRIALSANGRVYAGLAEAPALPANLELVNATDVPLTRVTFTDLVIVEKATHDLAAGTLTIAARSSDPAAVLTVPDLRLTVTANPQSFAGIAATAAEIVVVSDKGGTGSQREELIGAPGANLGVAANVVTPVAGRVGETISLDGSSSRGATAFAWAQTTGAAVVLASANAAVATFTPTAAGAASFTLTVQGVGGPKTAVAAVTVDPPLAPDQLVVDQAQYRMNSRQFRFGGTMDNLPNEVVVTFRGTELGRAVPDLTGAWSVRRTLLPSENALVPAAGNSASITSNTANAAVTITIRN